VHSPEHRRLGVDIIVHREVGHAASGLEVGDVPGDGSEGATGERLDLRRGGAVGVQREHGVGLALGDPSRLAEETIGRRTYCGASGAGFERRSASPILAVRSTANATPSATSAGVPTPELSMVPLAR